MTSVLTNTSALSALQSLTTTQQNLRTTQNRISSGLAVANASDNESYWSIGQTMGAQVAGLSAVQKSLSLTKSIADVTAAALTQVVSLTQSIQADVVTSQEAGVNVADVQQSIAGKQASLLSIVNSASFNGVNWLVSAKSYDVSEIYTLENTYSLSHPNHNKIYSSTPATSALSESITEHSTDSIVVTDPNGATSTYNVDTGFYSWTNSRVIGSTTYTSSYSPNPVTSGSETVSNPLTNYGIAPFSYKSDGISLGQIDNFSIINNVNVTINSSNDQYYAGQLDHYSSQSHNIADAGLLDISSQQTAQKFLASAIPGSIIDSVLSVDVTGTSSSSTILKSLNASLSGLTSVAASIGALQNQISNMQTFNSALSDALNSGIGSLVDADMNVTSTRLQALQTQQQLGIQALSIANNNSQLILKLFQAA